MIEGRQSAQELGNGKPSLTATLLEEAYARAEDHEIEANEEELICNLAGILYAGGADSVSQAFRVSCLAVPRSVPIQIASTLEIFLLAMIFHPDAQLTAHNELDAVVGSNRLVSFEDRSNLPYVEALCKELLRWHPLAPTAFPHRLIQDDVVGEYFIPAGTTVLGNSWSVACRH
jgi:hypothetical protein